MTENIELTSAPAAAADTGSGCACCSSGSAADERGAAIGSDEGAATAYGVVGMTCGHCVGAVTSELESLPGVRSVAVDLVVGGRSVVTVTSAAPLDEAAVSAAVDEAGYEFAGRVS